MAITTYFKTESNPGAKTNGWFYLKTTINQPIIRTTRKNYYGTKHHVRTVNLNPIYCHQENASEPTTDGLIETNTFDTTETIYTGTGGYIKSFTSNTSFFNYNQDFSKSPENWTIYWNGKITGISTGYTGYIKFEFYKRDTSNNDTLLFSVETTCNSIYSFTGNTLSVTPSGTITTTDRLRIRVNMYQALPH